MQKLTLSQRLWLYLMLVSGSKVFPFISLYPNDPEKDVRVITFAMSERDMNCSARDYVEELDNPKGKDDKQ